MNTLKFSLEKEIQNSIQVKGDLLLEISYIEKCFSEIISRIKNSGKIIVFGNGGSAADSQHLVAELIGRFRKKTRKPIPAIALTTNTSSLTAIGNDYSYDDIFYRQVLSLAHSNDVVIGISTSGNSQNIIKALKAAKQKKSLVIGLTGSNKNKIQTICDYCIKVPSDDTQRIQESHILIIHMLCGALEDNL